jgi:hypothetical protein
MLTLYGNLSKTFKQFLSKLRPSTDKQQQLPWNCRGDQTRPAFTASFERVIGLWTLCSRR